MPLHYVRADLRSGLGAITFERIGGFELGKPFQIFPDQTGRKMVLAGAGSPTYQNPDGLDEVWFVDDTVPLKGLTISGKGTTSISWTQQSGPLRYDVIRGDVASLSFGTGVVDLGTVTCVAPDVKDTSTGPSGQDDPTLPLPGQAFFYSYRGDQGANLPLDTYGASSGGLERVPTAGDCPL